MLASLILIVTHAKEAHSENKGAALKKKNIKPSKRCNLMQCGKTRVINYQTSATRFVNMEELGEMKRIRLLNNCLVSRLISIARGNLTVPRSIPETICPDSKTIYFHLRRPVVKALGGKNWPSSINLTFSAGRSGSLHSCVTHERIQVHILLQHTLFSRRREDRVRALMILARSLQAWLSTDYLSSN